MGLYGGSSTTGGLYSGGGNYSGPAFSSGSRKKKKKGGLLHGAGHVLSQGALDLKDAAVNLPGGVYGLSKTEINDLIAMAEGAPLSDPRRQRANKMGLGI